MKQLSILLMSVLLFTSCKTETKSESETTTITADSPELTTKQTDGLTLLKGDFLYIGDAAVLQTHREVYAVVIDEKMHELDAKVKAFKTESTDMVPVEIRGKISPKPEGVEGWPFVIEIKEILNITKPNPDQSDIIKLGN